MRFKRSVTAALFVGILLIGSAFFVSAAGAEDWTSRWDDAVQNETVIALSPGKDAHEMHFSWLSSVGTANQFRFGKSSEMDKMQKAPVMEKRTITGQKVCRVILAGLEPDTEYYYAYTQNDAWSDINRFHTSGEQLTALFVSDAQIGRSGDWKDRDVLIHDTAGWDTTLEQACSLNPDITLCLSAGDQVEKGFSERQYRLFLAPDRLRSVPTAPIIGNHEFYFPNLFYHFYLPNRFGGSIIHSISDEPYYFTQGNVLFIALDSNDPLSIDHERMIDEALRAYPDTTWQVVMMHHSLYSCEDSEAKGPILRTSLSPIFQKKGIDLVLSGHTHRYSRSFPIFDGKVSESGVTYLEGGCCSACNSKACPDSPPSYTAAGFKQKDVPVYSILRFDDERIRLTAFAIENGESVQMDSAAIYPNPLDAPQSMSAGIHLLHSLLSFFGRVISFLF